MMLATGRALPYAAALAACVLLPILACDQLTSAPERDPEDVLPSEIIKLRVTPTSILPADGKALDTLIARLPKDANARVVTFSTTGGVFQLTAAKQVTVRASKILGAGDSLYARAVLKSDTTAADVIVSAQVSDFRDTVWIHFTK